MQGDSVESKFGVHPDGLKLGFASFRTFRTDVGSEMIFFCFPNLLYDHG